MLLPVFLEVAVQVKGEIEVKFVLVLQSLALLPVVIGSIDIEEEIFRLLSNKD
jgi:hypothetical protein